MSEKSRKKASLKKYLPGLIFILVGACGFLLAFSSGPPLERTGDFGEGTCNASGCHSGNILNAAGGTFTISGAPQTYQPGVTYPITVSLGKPGQQRWGFELAVRTVNTGTQAGVLVATDSNTFVRSAGSGVQYITHTSNGTFSGNPQGGSWTFNWTAPTQDLGEIRFSSAGNAANNSFDPSGDFIYTTNATSIAQTQQALPITALFAQVAVGGGYVTTFSLLNTGSDPVIGKLLLTQSSGDPLESAIMGAGSTQQPDPEVPVVTSSIDLNIPPGGSRFITANPVSPGDPTKVGWAKVESSGGNLSGVATFQLLGGSNLQTIVGVLAGEKAESVTIPINDNRLQNRDTGYALANPEDNDVNITILLVDENGNVVRTLQPPDLNPLPSGRHTARFLWQDLGDANLNFKGSIVITASDGRQFAAVALVLDRGLFTAVPVIRGKAPGLAN